MIENETDLQGEEEVAGVCLGLEIGIGDGRAITRVHSRCEGCGSRMGGMRIADYGWRISGAVGPCLWILGELGAWIRCLVPSLGPSFL